MTATIRNLPKIRKFKQENCRQIVSYQHETSKKPLRHLPTNTYTCYMITADDLKSTRTFVLCMTQAQLANKLGVSLRTVGNWEREGVPASREYIVTRTVGDALKQWREMDQHLKYMQNMEPEPPISDEEYEAEQQAWAIHEAKMEQDIIENDRLTIRQYSNEILLEEIARRLRSTPIATVSPGDISDEELLTLAAKDPGYPPDAQTIAEQEQP